MATSYEIPDAFINGDFTSREIVIANIQIRLHKFLSENNGIEYKSMRKSGISAVQVTQLAKIVKEEFVYVVGEDCVGWASDMSWHLIQGIKCFVDGMIETHVWESFYDSITWQKFASIIFHNIESQLDNGLCTTYIRQKLFHS